MLSRRIKNNKNRKTRKKGGTNGWNDITLNNDGSKLPILYVLISGEGYMEDKTPPSLPKIKAEVSRKLKQILDALVMSEEINLDAPGNVDGDDDGGGDVDTPQTEWKNRKDQPLNPHYQFVNILFFHVSKENRIKYLFLYFLKKTFLDDINIIRLIDLAMKFISESTQVVDLNAVLNKLLIYYNETYENEYLIHPFLLVYAFLFNCKIKIDYKNGTLEVEILDLNTTTIYKYKTNVVDIQKPLTFELDKQFDETKPFSPNFLKPLPIVRLNKQPVLRIDSTEYELRVYFDGGEYKLESVKGGKEKFTNIQTLTSLPNCDAADFQLVLKYMIIYKRYIDNDSDKQLFVDQFHITNMSNDDLFPKIYEMMTRFAHMNIFIEINCRHKYTPAYITLAEARDVVKKMYTSIIVKIRNAVKLVYLDLDEEGIAIIVNYIVEDKFIFSVIIEKTNIAINNITQYLTFIRGKGITIANLTTNILRVLIWVIDLPWEWSERVMEIIKKQYQKYTITLNQRRIYSLIRDEEVLKGEILGKYQNYLECYAILTVRQEQVGPREYVIHSVDTLLKAHANYSDYKDLILIKPNGELRNVLRQGENITITYDKSLTNKFVELLQCSRADEEKIRGILSIPLPGKAKSKILKSKNQVKPKLPEAEEEEEEEKKRLGLAAGPVLVRAYSANDTDPVPKRQISSDQGNEVKEKEKKKEKEEEDDDEGESEEEEEKEMMEEEEEITPHTFSANDAGQAKPPSPPPSPPPTTTTTTTLAASSSSTAAAAQQQKIKRIPVIRINYTPIPLERTNLIHTNIDSTDIICYAFLGHPHILYIREVYKGCAGKLPQDINLRDFFNEDGKKNIVSIITASTERMDTYKQISTMLSGTSDILDANYIPLKMANQPSIEKTLKDIILARIIDQEFKDYTLLSLIVAYRIGGGAKHVAFLRKGSGNADECYDDIGNMTLSFDIFPSESETQVTLNEIDSVIGHRDTFNISQVVTLTFVMMHKKAVECVQSYLDNSGGGGNDADCLSVLDDINSRIDNIIESTQPIPKLSEEDNAFFKKLSRNI